MTDFARAVLWNVAVRRNVPPSHIISPRRTARITWARVEVLKLLIAHGYSIQRSAGMVNIDHTTALYHLGRLTDRQPNRERVRWHRPRIRGLRAVKFLPLPKLHHNKKRCLIPYAGYEVERIRPDVPDTKAHRRATRRADQVEARG